MLYIINGKLLMQDLDIKLTYKQTLQMHQQNPLPHHPLYPRFYFTKVPVFRPHLFVPPVDLLLVPPRLASALCDSIHKKMHPSHHSTISVRTLYPTLQQTRCVLQPLRTRGIGRQMEYRLQKRKRNSARSALHTITNTRWYKHCVKIVRRMKMMKAMMMTMMTDSGL